MGSVDVSERAPAITPKQARIQPDVRDRVFLPAAVELIETPPAPGAVWLTLTICGFVVAALAWCWFGHVDIYATARGKIEPAGHVKVVSALDSAKVAKINVVEGQTVRAGDALIVLDTREAQAAADAATLDAIAATAEAVQRQAALKTAASGDFTHPAAIDWPDNIPEAIRLRQEGVLRADLVQLVATIESLQAQKREKEAAVAQLGDSIAAQHKLMETLNERVGLKQELIDRDVGTKTGLLDAVQILRQAQAQLAGDVGKRTEALAAVKSLDAKLIETTTKFISDQTRAMVNARHLADAKIAERLKELVKIERMTWRSPVDGVVQALAVTSIGQVVTTGQELLRIVPSGSPVDIQAYVTNEDIGFVTVGQDAVIKIDSFPFTRYGTIGGTVEKVANDAIPTDTANRTLSDPTKISQAGSQSFTPTAKPMSDLVFEAKIRPDVYFIDVNGREVPLSPGMTVTVEIKTGSRRIIQYLFSPLVEIASRAMRER